MTQSLPFYSKPFSQSKLTALIALLFVFIPVFSQISQSEREIYFDDKQISSSKNAIKINLLWLLQKEAALIWEHHYAPKLSFQVGAGWIADGYHHSQYHMLSELNDIIISPKVEGSGWSLILENRFYHKTGPSSRFYNFSYKHRNFSDLHSNDLMIGVGLYFMLIDRFKLDFSANFCFRIINLKSPESSWEGDNYYADINKFNVDIPLSINIGYLLAK